MKTQMITYVRRRGQNSQDLYAAIQRIGPTWWHCVESVWLVKTSLTSEQVRDRLNSKLDANDKVLAASLSGDWATMGLDKNCNDWLRENM